MYPLHLHPHLRLRDEAGNRGGRRSVSPSRRSRARGIQEGDAFELSASVAVTFNASHLYSLPNLRKAFIAGWQGGGENPGVGLPLETLNVDA